MKILRLALIGSTFVVGACQRNTADNEAANFDPNTIAIADENGTATNTAAATGVDAAFVTEAMKGDNGEVAIGKLAETQAMSQAAKDFGKMLATDHGAHKEKLDALAASAGLTSTGDPADEAKTNLAKLKTLNGAAFDKEFKRMMVEDHEKDIAKYEKQASGGDPQTAALAKETLPTLRKHLETAKSL